MDIGKDLQDYFDDKYLHTGRSMKLTRQRSIDEVRQIIDLLDIQSHERILDLGCGWGRHTLAFAALGYTAVGVDASKAMIEKAKRLAKKYTLPANFHLGDYHSLNLIETFDVAMFLFGSFGFDTDSEQDFRLLQRIHSLLNRNGRLILDQWNPDTLKAKSGTISTEDDLSEEYHYDSEAKKVLLKRTYTEEKSTRRITIRTYTFEELGEMLYEVGFAKILRFDDYAGKNVTDNADNIVIVAKK